MMISRKRLMEIVREETEVLVNELGYCHDSKGQWDDCDPGNVYSLTKKAAKEHGIDDDYVQRGTITSKEKDKPPKVKAKFGINTSAKKAAGRKTISGDDISPKYHVKKYPQKYEERKGQKWDKNWPSSRKRKREYEMGKPNRKNWLHGYDEMDKLSRGVGLGILQDHQFSLDDLFGILDEAFGDSDAVQEGNTAQMRQRCSQLGMFTISDAQARILRSLNSFALAQDGKLNAPQDKQ